MREERFIKPTYEQLINAAILFNDGNLEKETLSNMVSLSMWVVDRLHENGDIRKATAQEIWDTED